MSQYSIVTDRIVSMLEKGVRPWVQDWAAGFLHGLQAGAAEAAPVLAEAA